MIIGYARVSTADQKLDAQIDALERVGAERLFSETISGATAKRPELQRMLDQLREGDVVVVTKYDRLARSLRDLLDIVEAIKERGAGFRSLAEDIDTTTPAGELIFHVFASIAHFELRRIAERTREGLAVARKQGRKRRSNRFCRRNEAEHFIDCWHFLARGGWRCLRGFMLVNYLPIRQIGSVDGSLC